MKAEPAQQRSLLELAEVDAELSRLGHRATHLPEQQRYDQISGEQQAAADRVGVLRIALEDLDAQVAKLESEVDTVRQREDRDRGLMESGSVQAKQLEELQHELGTLQRRQANLEDTLLEVMERREQLAAELSEAERSAEGLSRQSAGARQDRDAALADIERTRAERHNRRDEVKAALAADLLAAYERQLASTGVGAGRLEAGRCGACRIELDRGELGRISAAPADEVLQCPECRAILVRP